MQRIKVAIMKAQAKRWREKAFKTPQFELGALAGYWMAQAELTGADIPGNGIVERAKNYWRKTTCSAS